MHYKSSLNENTQPLSISGIMTNMLMFSGVSCFVMSLFSPVFFTNLETIQGYWVLSMGWMGIVFLQFAWYANPLNLLAILLVQKRPFISLLLSIVALIVASETFIFYEIPTGTNEEKMYIKELGLGFYLWYAAQIFFLLGLFSRLIMHIKHR